MISRKSLSEQRDTKNLTSDSDSPWKTALISIQISKKMFARKISQRRQEHHPERGKKFKKLKFSPAKHHSIEKMTLITNITIFLRLVSALAQETLKTREIREKS
jgi:hypothetical protein